jgi:hypothetical protein
MSISSKLSRITLVLGMFYLVSCTKTDFSKNDSLSLSTADNATIDLSTCKLRRIWVDVGGAEPITGVFTYSKGNPISLIFNVNGTGNPNHYWIYDKQNRLIEWRQTYDGGTFINQLHKYVYDASGKAIRDTFMFIEGDTITNVYTFTYDSQGRIVKENIKNIWNAGAPLNPTRNPTYTYDNRGNLAVAGWKSSSYDNKVNPLRTNPVFQFIFKNWSQNNPSAQAKYNSKGLPLSLQNNNDNFWNDYRSFRTLVYDCQ